MACSIEHFGHVLAIAFSVSAILYYIELRELITKRREEAVAIHEAARKAANKEWADELVQNIRKDMDNARAANRPWMLTPTREPSEEELKNESRLLSRMLLLDYSGTLLRAFPFITTALVFLSTATSLGALLVAGYYPEAQPGCSYMTFILAISFASIVWNVLVYWIYIPKISSWVAKG
ncbi:hypothetical protein [Bradyrhizobium zhanjiangense]|uniref:hypothetical protein n=1 Tax=Bradyrhizobium zhanjiangense TaxID=1325107 RepID=UPI001008A245|nr:hypothetical protein [Bradyrhizobium zhanjiangense]